MPERNLFAGIILRMEAEPAFWANALLRHRTLTGLSEAEQASRLRLAVILDMIQL